MPSRLYTRLCHAFLVTSKKQSIRFVDYLLQKLVDCFDFPNNSVEVQKKNLHMQHHK